MLKLHVVQALFGDSFIVEYEGADTSRFLLIDGGPSFTYSNHLKFALDEIVTYNKRVDLVVLTHIDNDHICGIIEFLEDMRRNIKKNSQYLHIDNFWHNTFRQNIGIESEIAPRALDLVQEAEWKRILYSLPEQSVRGISQGEQISRLALDFGIPVNDGFIDGLIMCENAPMPFSMKEFNIWIIGPNKVNLERLQREWCTWLENNVLKPIRREVINDTSIPNLSSIILLLEADGRSFLMTGDGTSREILEGLKAIRKLDLNEKIHVDILKLPHHGSARNVNKEFFEKVTADMYIISANGQNNNPEFTVLEWIVTCAYRQKRKIKIVATNDTASIRNLLTTYDHLTYGYTLALMTAGQHYITIELF